MTPKGNNFISPNGGADSPQGNGLYGSPPRRSFCSYKRNQNTLGAVPQDPLTLKLRLDTNDAKHRPYSAADTRSGCLRRILFGFCRPIAESYAAKTMGRTSNYLDRRPPPPPRGRGTGVRSRAPPVADAARRSTRSGRKERASEQREVLFGYRKAEGANTPWLPLERICAQYGFVFPDYLGKNNIRIQHS